MKKELFVKRSRIEAPVESLFDWHEKPGALERLSPPWDPIEVVSRDLGLQKGARTLMKIRGGPVSFKWQAEHTDYEKNRLFRDRQVKGPFTSWVHTHLFEPDGSNSSFLEDRVEFIPPVYPFGKLAAPHLKSKLEQIFHYRHRTVSLDLKEHLKRADGPLRILIAGGSGLIGSALTPFFTTGGHEVLKLVRRPPGEGEIYWDPAKGELNPADLEGIDVVIHLSGEPIAGGRWTPQLKKRVLDSRIKSTELLAKAMGDMDSPPKVFICASAIGFYGNRMSDMVTEDDPKGDAFISYVCDEWEKATRFASEKGIRTVNYRIGMVLSPLGGALKELLPSFLMGAGGKIGNGRQYMSWIGIDDIVGGIYHAINTESLEGPVNAVGPDPMTNAHFTKVLGKVLNRPTLFTVPQTAIKLIFGEMGKELLLEGVRVFPEKLLKSGYVFRDNTLEGALRHVLGKNILF